MSHRLPGAWIYVGSGQAKVHPDVRYVPAIAMSTVPRFVAAIEEALRQSGREWIVMPTTGLRPLLPSRYRFDLESIAGAMLRVMGIDLGVAGRRYVVGRAIVCRPGLHEGGQRRYEPDGRLVCPECDPKPDRRHHK